MYPPIFTICAADSGVQSVLGASPTRLYPFGEAPEGVALPYAVWQTIGGYPENYIGDNPDLDTFSVQVDVYAETCTSARSGAEALRNALQGHAHITAWRGESRDAETRNYRYSFDVDFLIER